MFLTRFFLYFLLVKNEWHKKLDSHTLTHKHAHINEGYGYVKTHKHIRAKKIIKIKK